MNTAKIKRFLLGASLIGGLIAAGTGVSRGGKTKEKRKDKIENNTKPVNNTVLGVTAKSPKAQDTINPNDKYNNVALFEESRSKIKFALAFVENYSQEAYFCGEAWTLGHGLTILYNADGSSRVVVPGDKCTLEESDIYKGRYLTYEVLRDIKQYIHVPMDEATLVTTCVFRYCVGRTNFKKSKYLKQLNAGQTGAELAKYLTGFRKQKGVLKRCYFFAAWMSGEITFDDLTDLRAEGCYNLKLADICKYGAKGKMLKDTENMAMWDFSKVVDNLAKAKQPRKSILGECKLTRDIVPGYIVQEIIKPNNKQQDNVGLANNKQMIDITLKQTADTLYNDAWEKYNNGDYKAALGLLKDLAKTDYNGSVLQNDISLVYYDSGDFRRALTYAKNAMDLAATAKEKSDAFFSMAKAYAARQKYKDAIECYDNALGLVNSPVIRRARAKTMSDFAKFDFAKSERGGKNIAAFLVGAALLGKSAKKYGAKIKMRRDVKQTRAN